MPIIQTKKPGEVPPYGLSREHKGAMVTLRLPLFPWHGRAYQVHVDAFVTGWHLKDLYIRFGTANRVLRKALG
jgi:hypothetical protein